ncbi:H-type lectin domain-containing protein [Rhodobacteraceae bacterium HSP-20]|uniref:H-type lectin domain-containing protein n=1 Tax=Paragemmobacter amnigenus TaxID=2852097 RepID=A0ABS6J2U7_9RHOB|nr:H-type lectin domain-containing protein [Rhodobacter amnigenus]MBU9698081.1 H-type lectin domain-containing protein [Rhodobacter amnigenus]MBV4389308.1 H-type lectin domain-containing protein [Rhodobacter amnigenus]
MKRIGANSVGIEQGSRQLFSDYATNGVMWTGSGDRESRTVVAFSEPFILPPAVMVGVSLWDMDHETNMRADLVAENVTEAGFHLVFRTWGDTRIARLRADWTAIGPVRDPDDWDIG